MLNTAPPRSERVGDVLFCDKLPYPTDYVKQRLFAVVFVPNDPISIKYAKDAIENLIAHGRLHIDLVKLRTVQNPEEEYDFDGMIQGFLDEVQRAKEQHAKQSLLRSM